MSRENPIDEVARVAALLLAHDHRITVIETEIHSAFMWTKWFAGAGLTLLAAILASGWIKP
jgi:hypothetical protein